MKNKEIKIKGKEYLTYVVADYSDKEVCLSYKSGSIKWGDKGNYRLKRAVFDASYDKKTNSIDLDNLAYVAPTAEELNAEIQAKREQAYKDRSDSLYMAWQKYLALGDEKKAEEKKALWIAEFEKINKELPYKS